MQRCILKAYLNTLILSNLGDRHVLVSISKDTGKTKLVAMTWLDCNRQDFVGIAYGVGEGGQINRKCTHQLNKSSDALSNKIIIEGKMPKMIKQYYKGVGNIDFHNRVCVDKVHLERNILTKDWARRFNLSIFGMVCITTPAYYTSVLFMSPTRRKAIASSLAVSRTSSLTTHREFAQHKQPSRIKLRRLQTQ